MGWILALVLGALSLAALYLSGKCSRLALEMAAAAILIAIAGYGWQGSPDMPGHPVASTSR
jgi:cytochrome c-type biogenesis protein CcmH